MVNTEENEDNIKTANQKNILLENEAVVATAKAGSPQKGKVLLQTAKTYAFCNETGKRVKVRVLLDLGGQHTFILDKVKDKLGLKMLKSELVNLNTFGDNKYHKRKCDLVKLNLETVDSGELEIFALSTPSPTICSPLRSQVNVSEFSHLQG